jgi:uncharacterized membrane protein
MNASFIQRVSLTSALILIFTIGSANAAAYSWREVLVPSIGPVNAAGINDEGQVVVGTFDGSKWGIYRNGGFRPLPSLPAGYKISLVWGINNSGIVVGSVFPPTDPTHEQGFILIGSKYTFFSWPGWDNTAARGIANSGLITGYSYTDDGSAYAGFIYDPGKKTFTDATPPGSGFSFSVTQGMNAAGRITGDGRSVDIGRYAFVWQQGTLIKGTHELAPFLDRIRVGDANSAARGINDAGVIVGFTARADGTPVGFVGSDSRGFELLVPPGGDAPGNGVVCEGINNLRQVLCSVSDVNGNTVGAFIGTPDENDQ